MVVFLAGEALLGKAEEVAHVEVLIGDKAGTVGNAFVEAFANPRLGHTPLLAVIRPNLPCKPLTLIVPKVTVKHMDEAAKVYGPAQSAIAKAVADSVAEGIIPLDKIEEWVIICSVFVHPHAKDYVKIYLYNYSATKLAIKRALSNYPNVKKIMEEKDKAIHPIMGFRLHHNLWRPPYLHINFDIPSIERISQILELIPESDRIIFEVGGPLYRKHGEKSIETIREKREGYFIFVNLDVPQVPKVEVDLAFEATANGVIASAGASDDILNAFIYEAKRVGIYAAINFEDSSVNNILSRLESLNDPPHCVILPFKSAQLQNMAGIITQIKQKNKGRILVALSGEIAPSTAQTALTYGGDVLRVDRYITQAKDVERTVREFLSLPEFALEIDHLRKHVE
ncbi:MAG: bifunctional 5,6,7,8-tetrahydromethanopterin hydro-lyase/3-hexulose-6-phosphate synthase [Candidatus Bathyarchaeia archaeon]